MPGLIDLRGRTFGGLTVVARAANPARSAYWNCECAGCGTVVAVDGQALRRGTIRSCGQPGCRGRFSRPEPAETLRRPGNLSTAVALLRASVDDDHLAVRDVFVGLDDDDDLVAIALHLLRVGTTALVKAESGRDGAHAVVDSLAAMARREAQ